MILVNRGYFGFENNIAAMFVIERRLAGCDA
jgi:hypothetical protein